MNPDEKLEYEAALARLKAEVDGLKNCPFCGNSNPEIVSGDGVYCDQCWASVPFDSWQRRTPGTATARMLARLESLVEEGVYVTPSELAFIAEHEPRKEEQ